MLLLSVSVQDSTAVRRRLPIAALAIVAASLLFVVPTTEAKTHDTGENACSQVVCRAGRECRIHRSGLASCECVEHCPDHHNPVCGSNNRSYENHCLLHRDACLKGAHISVRHKGHCRPDPVESPKPKDQTKPVVCFQGERDSMRQKLIDWFQSQLEDKAWFHDKTTYSDVLWAKFYVCDTNHDGYMDANEFLECVRQNETVASISTGENVELVRALCVDAIIDTSDSNNDWRLDFTEFKSCMDPSFKPPKKLCSLEEKQFDDGAETKVDCNYCLCACGNWVCTSMTCSKKKTSEDNSDGRSPIDADVIEEINESNGVNARFQMRIDPLVSQDDWDDLFDYKKKD